VHLRRRRAQRRVERASHSMVHRNHEDRMPICRAARYNTNPTQGATSEP
jgi:hypothetical protein